MKIYETDYYKAAPDWLKLALMNPDWVKQQSEAWSHHNRLENLGSEPPLFLEVGKENLADALHQLAKRYLSVAQHHREVGASLLSVIESHQYQLTQKGKE